MREEWTYKKFGDVASFSRGLTYSKSDVAEESSNKVLRSNNIDLDTHLLNFDDVVCLKEDFMIPADKKFKKNDIFICMSNGSTKHLGKVAFIEKDIDYAFGGFMGAIHPKVEEAYPKFTFYYCLSSEYRRSLASVLNGININNIKWSDLSKFPIPIPPLAEQERIVAELDLLSSIIEKKKAQLKELDQLAQSIFYDMFGDPITNEKGWEVIQLGSKCEVSSFKRVLIEDVVDEGVPFIRGTELMTLSKGEKTSFTLFITQEHYEKVKNISGVPKIGDLLIPSINANGCIWILDTEEPRYYKDGRVLWVHVDEKYYSSQALKFIMHSLIKNTYSSVASGATFAELKLFVLRELNTILPPLPLQKEFAEKIEAIERQKTLIQQSIDEVQTMFDYTMDKYFG